MKKNKGGTKSFRAMIQKVENREKWEERDLLEAAKPTMKLLAEVQGRDNKDLS